MGFVAAFFIGAYFMSTFDNKKLAQPTQGAWETVKKYYDAFKFSHVKKGIDLAGGTYLVLGVEIDKALESRLLIESKNIEQLLKNKNVKSMPVKKDVKDLNITLEFADEDAAKISYNIIQESKASLRVKTYDNVIIASLSPEIESRVRSGAVEQAISVLSNRLGGYGVEGIIIQQHGDKQIVVQLPGMDDAEHVKSVITKTAHLDFKLIEKDSPSKESLLDMFDGELPADKMIIPGRTGEEGETTHFYLVSAFADVTGEHITDARVSYGEFNKAETTFKLDSVGAKDFAEVTSNNIGRRLGIIIDNVVYSAPNIQSAIPGGTGVITGLTSQKEAVDLSIVLRSGALLAPLKIDQENRVSSSLGQDAIDKGLMSCLIALLLLFVFSIFYYKIPGLFAIIALLYNLFLTILFLSYFKATLTMPGIAGMVLDIGMAIDASILIYERVKEELAAGQPLRKAVENGFNGAFVVILDSNITSFLTGFVLYQFGGPAIKGFAITWMLGIIATLLSGIFFLKSIFRFLFDNFPMKSLKF